MSFRGAPRGAPRGGFSSRGGGDRGEPLTPQPAKEIIWADGLVFFLAKRRWIAAGAEEGQEEGVGGKSQRFEERWCRV